MSAYASSINSRRDALQCASQAVVAMSNPGALQDPESVARRTISIAIIFEQYLDQGPLSLPVTP